MKSFLFFFLLTTTALHSQPVGFDGLNLGMTQAEVNALVTTSHWEYGYRAGIDAQAADNEQHDPKGIGIALYNRSVIGCVRAAHDSLCFRPDQIRVRYYLDRVFDIDLWGPWSYDNNRRALADYATTMIASLSGIYGEPTMLYESPVSVVAPERIDQLDAEGGNFIDIAEWQWTRPSRSRATGSRKPRPTLLSTIRVRLYRTEESGTRKRHSTIIVDLTDEVMTEEVRSLVQY